MKIKKISFVLIFMFFIADILFLADGYKAEAFEASLSEIVMEKESERILYERNAREKLPMASTTKIITALTVIENYNIEQEITVPSKCVGVEGSSVYLKKGDVFTVEDLLYGLMLRSGNDCAETLAVCLAGSIEKFVEKMNETALSCGARDTNLKNPHGLPDDEHYTTAYDLCKISCKAMRNSVFKKIVSTKRHIATERTTGNKIVWINKNKLLTTLEGASGVKTGYTVKAGRCLVSSAERNGMEVVCVALKSGQMFERSEELIDNAFAEYSYQKIFDAEKFDYKLFDDQLSRFVTLKAERDFFYPIKNSDDIKIELDLPERLDFAGIKNGEIGEVKIYCQKQLIFSEKIYTLNI
ncbi:MAG: D-alanyl-D-alanine carboxypeptidase [Clostridia bacterium]|nr:D-alanyl-D-alanine carboxypeptidase [Clostridia bacterium]